MTNRKHSLVCSINLTILPISELGNSIWLSCRTRNSVHFAQGRIPPPKRSHSSTHFSPFSSCQLVLKKWKVHLKEHRQQESNPGHEAHVQISRPPTQLLAASSSAPSYNGTNRFLGWKVIFFIHLSWFNAAKLPLTLIPSNKKFNLLSSPPSTPFVTSQLLMLLFSCSRCTDSINSENL